MAINVALRYFILQDEDSMTFPTLFEPKKYDIVQFNNDTYAVADGKGCYYDNEYSYQYHLPENIERHCLHATYEDAVKTRNRLTKYTNDKIVRIFRYTTS